jgi:Flp pilus assembly protein TadG
MSFDPPPLPPIQPPWGSFQVWWQQVLGQLKNELGGLETAIDALNAANAAQAAADAAEATATTTKRDDKITASSIIPANVLTATDAGTDATIAAAAHTRIYGDASQLSVGGHTFTGLAYSTAYGIYYDDPTCSDTTPTYHTTTTISNALNNFVAGRHFVGTVTTPAAGGAASSGGVSPPGYGGGSRDELSSI